MRKTFLAIAVSLFLVAQASAAGPPVFPFITPDSRLMPKGPCANGQTGVYNSTTKVYDCANLTGGGDLKADGTVPLSAHWNLGAFNITASAFIGALTGNASTASALAADPANCAAGQLALGVNASGVAECSANPSLSTLNLTGANTLALGTSRTNDGKIIFSSGTALNDYLFNIVASNFGANLTWILPTAAPGGANYLLNVDADGTMGYTDPATLGGGAGDVTGAGDCASGACYDGSSDGGTYIRLYDGTSAYESITGGVRLFTFGSSTADAENLILTLGANDNTVTLSSGTGAATLNANAFVISSNGLVPDAADGAALGSATAEWADLFLADGGKIYFQNDQSVYLTPSASTLTLTGTMAATGFSGPINGTIGATTPAAGTFTTVTTAATASPTITLLDSDALGADKEIGKIVGAYIDGADGSENGTVSIYAHEAGTTTEYIQVDGKNVTIDLLKPVTTSSTLVVGTDLTVTGADITLAAAGVKLTGANGALTILGLGDGQDEDLKIDLNSTANTIEITSPASSATIVDFNTMGVVVGATNGIQVGATGVLISSDDDGAITFTGKSAGSDEDLTINLDDTADTAVFSSSTGVTKLDFSALNLVTTGTIQGGIAISSDADGMNAAAMTAAGVNGTMFIATGAGTWILPRAVLGNSLCLMDSGTAHDLILDVTAGSTIRLKGTEQADGVGITNASGTSTGDFICVIAVATDKWSTVGMQGTWASQ